MEFSFSPLEHVTITYKGYQEKGVIRALDCKLSIVCNEPYQYTGAAIEVEQTFKYSDDIQAACIAHFKESNNGK